MKLLRASSLLLCASAISMISMTACLEPPEPAKPAKVEEPAKAEAPPAGPLTPETDQGLKPTTEPLTAEEERVIAADPKTLSPDELRMRGHALRKKVMMNPDSDAAKALNDAREAVLSGDVDPNADKASEDKGLVLQAPPHLRQPAEKPSE
jgi:hypothetical protein